MADPAGVPGPRLPPDPLLTAIADYVVAPPSFPAEAYDTARWCLFDTLGCGLLALGFPACARHIGPIVPGTVVPQGVRVPGTAHVLDPVQAAFCIGTMIRWLDFNDTWLAAEWGHPSDNLGALLACADWRCRTGAASVTVAELLTAMIQAHEIQGVLALENAFNRVGLDHVILVKVASAAVAARLLGATRAQIIDTISQAWVDGHPLRTYRHAPNTVPRKSWAAGDATARAVFLALMTLRGERGLPTALSAPRWGFQEVLFRGQPVRQAQPFGSYVMEHVLFKIAYPAEFHAQTAVEAAIRLRPQVIDRLDRVALIRIWTHEAALRIICKEGPLDNPADRDHCLQYMVAVGLLEGTLTAAHYEDGYHASHPQIDRLRGLMRIVEDPAASADYLDPAKRSIANALEIEFTDGTRTPRVAVEYPLGHRRRRQEGMPLLEAKLATNLATRLPPERCRALLDLARDPARLLRLPVSAFVELFVPS